MAIVRKVDLKGDIIKGETITFNYPEGTNIDLIDPNGVKTSYVYPFPDIDTNTWGGVSGLQLLIVLKHTVYNNLK
ncbi:hypothetical protein [Escherichia coli]|uniref:hypothetical protein n=1 Tax=Escherichia coli TaxID=562 RepID=UPI000DD96B91|nr:hypothetical protein [Escherichia coli]